MCIAVHVKFEKIFQCHMKSLMIHAIVEMMINWNIWKLKEVYFEIESLSLQTDHVAASQL